MRTLLTAVIVVLLATPRLARAQNASFDQSFRSSTAASSAQSAMASEVSSTVTLIVLGAGLLAGVGGGITTTMYRKNDPNRARRKQDALPPQPLPPPEPLPYPGTPGIGPGETPPPLPGPSPSAPPPPPVAVGPSLDAMVLARAWLLANEVQLKQDLALGAGPALDDLAGIAGIAPAHRAHFGRVLQRNRALLQTPHLVTPQQAAAVMSRVGELVLADQLLRPDGEAVLAAL